MSSLNTFLSNARHFALVALLAASVAFAGCGGSNGGDDDDDDEIIVPPQTEFAIPSSPDLDGVVQGDNLQSQSSTAVRPIVGDGPFVTGAGASRFVGYYSFDLSAIPAGATIKTATMRLHTTSTVGNPQGMMVLVRVDHVNYGALFPQTVLGAVGLDFNFATINDIGVVGPKEIDVAEQLQADLDAGRARSQYRLRGAIATNADNVADQALMSQGEDAGVEIPMLVVEIE